VAVKERITPAQAVTHPSFNTSPTHQRLSQEIWTQILNYLSGVDYTKFSMVDHTFATGSHRRTSISTAASSHRLSLIKNFNCLR
jgi:hypothetical protein